MSSRLSTLLTMLNWLNPNLSRYYSSIGFNQITSDVFMLQRINWVQRACSPWVRSFGLQHLTQWAKWPVFIILNLAGEEIKFSLE